jgi:hypothetical protein
MYAKIVNLPFFTPTTSGLLRSRLSVVIALYSSNIVSYSSVYISTKEAYRSYRTSVANKITKLTAAYFIDKVNSIFTSRIIELIKTMKLISSLISEIVSIFGLYGYRRFKTRVPLNYLPRPKSFKK